MQYDASRARTVVVGGSSAVGALNDVWEWNGADWQQRPADTQPPSARSDAAMAYDSDHGRLQMFGGFDGANYLNDLWTLQARIDLVGPGNTAHRESLRFYSQPVLGQPLQFGFTSPQGVGFYTIGFGPLQQPLGPIPAPPLCEPGSFYANAVSLLAIGSSEPNISWLVPNTPLIQGVTLVFQAFALQPAGCWRVTDGLQVRF
jgi:hypothetical protein